MSSHHRPPGMPPGILEPSIDEVHLDDRLARWFSDRIFNDREIDQGFFMMIMGAWIGFFPTTMAATTWWAAAFKIIDPPVWTGLLVGLGAGRITFSVLDHRRLLAGAAFFSCLLLAFLAIVLALVNWRMIGAPVLGYHAWQAAKSHARLMLNRRLHR